MSNCQSCLSYYKIYATNISFVEDLENRYLSVDTETEKLILKDIHLKIHDFHGLNVLNLEWLCSKDIPKEYSIITTSRHKCVHITKLKQVSDTSFMPGKSLYSLPRGEVVYVHNGIKFTTADICYNFESYPKTSRFVFLSVVSSVIFCELKV